MIRLNALQLAIAAWKTTLEISGKARPRTWVALAALHVCVAGAAFWAYQATTVSSTEIPPVELGELKNTPLSVQLHRIGGSTSDLSGCVMYAHIGAIQADSRMHPHVMRHRAGGKPTSQRASQIAASSPKIASFSWVANANVGTYQWFSVAGSNFSASTEVFLITSENTSISKRPISAPRQRNNRVVVQPCDPPPILAPTESRVALMVHVFEDLMALLAVFFAWQQYRLRKSQELLMALQMREIQERFDRLEKARQKQTEKEEKSLIILP